MRRRDTGITVLELLVVVAILAVVLGIGVINGRAIAQRQAARGAIATFQQSVWQGATAAASRGLTVDLNRTASGLSLVDVGSQRVLRRYDLPPGVVIPAENPILRFTPPGKVELAYLEALPGDFVITTGEGRYRIEISLIGEVESTRIGDA